MEIQTIQSAIAGIHRINEFFALEELEEKNSMEGFAAAVADKSETENRSSDENTAKAGAETEKTGWTGEDRAEALPFVEFRDVVFGYDEHIVLNHVSFKVMDGDQVTLAGRTGAGKSTILKLLLGLYEPQSGEVLIHGVPAAQIKEEERRKLFGYVEQTFHMVPGTVREEITLFDPAITEAQVHAAAELTGLKEAIERLENGYDTVCTPELFSQGQWQLLSIARAAAADPSLLLLDEITANLDAETEKAVLQALKRVVGNRTVVSISHRISAEMGRIIAV